MKANYGQIAKLVKQAKEHDSDAFTTLYELTYQNVYCLSYSILKDAEEARDATQEVYIKVFQNLDGLVDEITFIAWLNKIAYHTCRRMAEKRTVPVLDDVDLSGIGDTSGNSDPAVAVVRQERTRALYALMDNLDPTLRSTVVLKYFNDLKVSEIAAAMDCPEGTVKSRLNTARRKMSEGLRHRERDGGLFMAMLCFNPFKQALQTGAPEVHMDAGTAKDILFQALEQSNLPLTAGEGFTPQAAYRLSLSPAKAAGGAAAAVAAAVAGLGVAAWLLTGPAFQTVTLPPALTREAVTVTATLSLPEAGLAEFYAVAPDGGHIGGTWDGETSCQVSLPENGAYELWAVTHNGREAVQTVEVTTIDREGPVLDGYTAQGGVLILDLSDGPAGVDYESIYGVTADGKRVAPTATDPAAGTVRFADPGQDFQVSVSDRLGNASLHQVTRFQLN